MKKTLILMTAMLVAIGASAAPKTYTVSSPDGKLAMTITSDGGISWSLASEGKQLMAPSAISMTLEDGTVYGSGRFSTAKVKGEDYNGLTLKFKECDILFRAYNEGVAYRFVSKAKAPFKVTGEQASFALPEDWPMFVAYVRADANKGTLESQLFNSHENTYMHFSPTQWDIARLAFLPVLVDVPGGEKLCIMESDLTNYPGMYLYNGDGDTSLEGFFARYPKDVEQGGHNMLQMVVTSREDFIAKYDGATSFPWRIVGVSREDKELLVNNLVYKLATPADPEMDFSWVRPGKVAWEWWNAWNLSGVDFKTGVNNDTYKYYIDFASKYGIEYVILDEGWAVNLQADLMQVVPEIDLRELVDYAAERNVGIILWAGYWAFDRDLENVCKYFSEMGVKGFKVDFMDRDDQVMVDFHRRAAEVAAKYKLVLDFHGTYKPAGLDRTWPNVLNYEGVYGLEQMKWDEKTDHVKYDVTIPFIRMVPGPMDYTQGAMRNANKQNFKAVFTEAMSQGTRCRQLAEYVVFNSPLNMLCDTPTNYMREPECTKFIAEIPTVWDEVVPLEGKVAEYVAVAKRSGDTWYVGGMTDWTPREMDIDLQSILGSDGKWDIQLFTDGVNADKVASDWRKKEFTLSATDNGTLRLRIPMAPGGGFAIRITPAR